MSKRHIMIADDETEIRELFREVLENRGYEVTACATGDEAIEVLTQKSAFAAFVDIRMPGMDGIETLRAIKRLQPNTQVVMITGYSNSVSVEEALKLGCFVCMMKPFKLKDILGLIDVLEAGEEELPLAA